MSGPSLYSQSKKVEGSNAGWPSWFDIDSLWDLPQLKNIATGNLSNDHCSKLLVSFKWIGGRKGMDELSPSSSSCKTNTHKTKSSIILMIPGLCCEREAESSVRQTERKS